jgi:hypothetical protein
MAAENILMSNIAANGRADMLVNGDLGESDRRWVSQNGILTFAIVASAVGITLQVRSQYRTIAPLQTVEAGGTTGVFPDMQQKAQTLPVYAGEKLVFEVRETAGTATTDIMLSIDTP